MKNDPLALSVFIIAKNEADRIEATIASVIDICNEVIVIDSGSTDETTQRARAAGAEVIHQDFLGYGPQKRFGEQQCKHDWVLNIDADEPLTDAARLEISRLKESGELETHQCWRIPIKTIYPHEARPAPWSFDYNQIRLYNRQSSGFSTSHVHDVVLPGDGVSIGQLRGSIAHHSHRTIHFQVEKFNRYSEMQVADLRAKGRHLSHWRLISEFPLSFLKAYFIRRHFLYGLWGVSLSISYAYSRFLRVAKFHEQDLLERKEGR